MFKCDRDLDALRQCSQTPLIAEVSRKTLRDRVSYPKLGNCIQIADDLELTEPEAQNARSD
jgi:hypothetical protein